MTSATPRQAAEVLHEVAEAIAADERIAPGARLVCASILDARADAVLHPPITIPPTTAPTTTEKEHRA